MVNHILFYIVMKVRSKNDARIYLYVRNFQRGGGKRLSLPPPYPDGAHATW